MPTIAGGKYYDTKERIYLDYDIYLQIEGYLSNRVRLTVYMPDKHYLALSFGGSHFASDMILFYSNDTRSYAYDYYLDGYGEPLEDED